MIKGSDLMYEYNFFSGLLFMLMSSDHTAGQLMFVAGKDGYFTHQEKISTYETHLGHPYMM